MSIKYSHCRYFEGIQYGKSIVYISWFCSCLRFNWHVKLRNLCLYTNEMLTLSWCPSWKGIKTSSHQLSFTVSRETLPRLKLIWTLVVILASQVSVIRGHLFFSVSFGSHFVSPIFYLFALEIHFFFFSFIKYLCTTMFIWQDMYGRINLRMVCEKSWNLE